MHSRGVVGGFQLVITDAVFEDKAIATYILDSFHILTVGYTSDEKEFIAQFLTSLGDFPDTLFALNPINGHIDDRINGVIGSVKREEFQIDTEGNEACIGKNRFLVIVDHHHGRVVRPQLFQEVVGVVVGQDFFLGGPQVGEHFPNLGGGLPVLAIHQINLGPPLSHLLDFVFIWSFRVKSYHFNFDLLLVMLHDLVGKRRDGCVQRRDNL